MIAAGIFACTLLLALAGVARLGYRLGRRDERKDGDRRCVTAFARGFDVGRQAGGAEMEQRWVSAVFDGPDAIESAWPVERRGTARPS